MAGNRPEVSLKNIQLCLQHTNVETQSPAAVIRIGSLVPQLYRHLLHILLLKSGHEHVT